MIWHKIFHARCLPQAEFCGVLWCVCFFFSLLMSARAAHLFLWAASQGKPCKINLGAFLKGPNVSLSWRKALNFCQRCDFWKPASVGKPTGSWVSPVLPPACWNMMLNTTIHSQCLQFKPKPPCCVLAPQITSRSFQLQAGKLLAIRKNVTYFSHLCSFCSWFIFVFFVLNTISIP